MTKEQAEKLIASVIEPLLVKFEIEQRDAEDGLNGALRAETIKKILALTK